MIFDPIPLGAGAGALGFLFTLIYVLLKYVNSQGGSWQTLVREAQADAASSRAESASLRVELTTERDEHGVTRAENRDLHAENRDLHQRIRGLSP